MGDDLDGVVAAVQAEKAGIEFTALDNGFASGADLAAVQRICDPVAGTDIDALLRSGWPGCRTRSRSPTGRPGDRTAGYRYEVSVLQAEFSQPMNPAAHHLAVVHECTECDAPLPRRRAMCRLPPIHRAARAGGNLPQLRRAHLRYRARPRRRPRQEAIHIR